MANIGKWATPGTLTTLLSTALNGLGNNPSTMATSSTYGNDTNLDIYADFEVVLASYTPTNTFPFIALYILESVDGTNFPAQSAADMRLATSQLLAVIPVGSTASTAQRAVARNILIPPTKFQIQFDNQTGAALAGSGNTLKILPYDYNLNG